MIRKAILRSELAVFRKGSRRSQWLRSAKPAHRGTLAMIGKARLRERIGCVSQKVAAAIGYDLQSMPRQRIGYVSQSGQQESIGCDRPTHCRSKLAMIRKAGARQHPNWR
jgi:hypothetical protein